MLRDEVTNIDHRFSVSDSRNSVASLSRTNVPFTLLEAVLIHHMNSFIGDSVTLIIQIKQASDNVHSNDANRYAVAIINDKSLIIRNVQTVLRTMNNENNR
jgi:hypothetical protein